jgi:hypothetical protein
LWRCREVSEKKEASDPEKKPERSKRTAKKASLIVIDRSNYFNMPPGALEI